MTSMLPAELAVVRVDRHRRAAISAFSGSPFWSSPCGARDRADQGRPPPTVSCRWRKFGPARPHSPIEAEVRGAQPECGVGDHLREHSLGLACAATHRLGPA